MTTDKELEKIKILGIEFNDISIHDLRKFSKTKISQYTIPSKERKEFLDINEIEMFETLKIWEQVDQINQIKDKFDLCIVTSWSSARIAYLADLNYIMWFVGNDIRFPPFLKKFHFTSSKKQRYNLNTLERRFYRKILDESIVCITGSEEMFEYLKKFRSDSIRIDRAVMNTKLFKSQKTSDKNQTFTIFCPQRITFEKGTDIIWDAISKCKNNFNVIQVDWFDSTVPFVQEERKELLVKKPNNVKLIEKIPRNKIFNYYLMADAIIGDMKIGYPNNIEREAALCNKPVLCYNNSKMKFMLDEKEIVSPFLPTSKDPNELSVLIDKLIESKEFREKLANDEFKFINNLGDPDKAAREWDEVFFILKNKYKSIRKNSSKKQMFCKKILYKIGLMLHFGKKHIDYF